MLISPGAKVPQSCLKVCPGTRVQVSGDYLADFLGDVGPLDPPSVVHGVSNGFPKRGLSSRASPLADRPRKLVDRASEPGGDITMDLTRSAILHYHTQDLFKGLHRKIFG
jgi:hypothetical protein